MNRNLLVAIALATGMGPLMGSGRYEPARDTTLLHAIEQVESGGRRDAIGDGGRAIGILQIHPVMVDDVNRIQKLRGSQDLFTYSDRRDVAKSRRMFWIYADHYNQGASREVIARCWNGGPTGDRKDATIAYWEKVKAEIARIENERTEKAADRP